MNISIEILAFGVPIIFGIGFFIFLTLIKYYRIWRYKPENDKGRKAEYARLGKTLGGVELGSPDKQTTGTPKRRSVFSLSSIARTRRDKKGISEPSRSHKRTSNPFIRRK